MFDGARLDVVELDYVIRLVLDPYFLFFLNFSFFLSVGNSTLSLVSLAVKQAFIGFALKFPLGSLCKDLFEHILNAIV